MAASITDLLCEPTTTSRPDAGALTAQKLEGAASITVDTTAGWPTATAVHFVIYQVTAAGVRVEGTQTEWKGIVTSSTAIGTLTLQAGTDQVYPIGSKVICTPTAAWGDDLVEGILTHADQDGTLKAGAVDNAAVITDSIITPAKFTTALQGDWKANLLPAVSSVTENGNRSADITFASTVANILTPGMRIRTSRTVAAPTYMGGAFNGTNHYFTKVTPTSTLSTITDNITLMGHVEPTSYAACAIEARYDVTTANGVGLQLNASGQIVVQFTNGGGGNSRIATSYQSVPLNKKSFVAATYTSTATTFVIYLDGVSIPFSVATGGTAPTTFGTGGDFSIGRYGANASGYFPGYISGCGVFNAVLSAATIRSYKNQVLSGSETNCIGAWSLNNTGVNQQAAGTNDLTATNSVGYTSGRAPYCTDANGTAGGTYDYAIVTKVATTVATVQYPEGCAIPTSGGISTVDYSGVKSPFGMPIDSGRWSVSRIDRTQTNTSSNATFAAVTGHSFTVPVGAWEVGWRGNIFNTSTTAVWWCLSDVSQTGLAVSTSDRSLQSIVTSPSAAATHIDVTISKEVAHSATATYQMYTLGATTSAGVLGSSSPYDFTAKLTYL